jgi:DNA mismatch repair protein MSH2
MARKKADELEDFSGKDSSKMDTSVPKEDVEEGSKLLKNILVEWKDLVREKGCEDNENEMIGAFKELLEKNKLALEGNTWIQEAMAL